MTLELHLRLQGMVFIYFIYLSFRLSYSLQRKGIVRQCHNYNPDSFIFVLSTREYYPACTANLLFTIANTLPLAFLKSTRPSLIANASSFSEVAHNSLWSEAVIDCRVFCLVIFWTKVFLVEDKFVLFWIGRKGPYRMMLVSRPLIERANGGRSPKEAKRKESYKRTGL